MKHYMGEVGTDFTLDTETDVSGADNVEIIVQKPDGTEETWDATPSGNNVVHTLGSGDFDQSGVYKFQAKVTNGSQVWFGETVETYIYENFE